MFEESIYIFFTTRFYFRELNFHNILTYKHKSKIKVHNVSIFILKLLFFQKIIYIFAKY